MNFTANRCRVFFYTPVAFNAIAAEQCRFDWSPELRFDCATRGRMGRKPAIDCKIVRQFRTIESTANSGGWATGGSPSPFGDFRPYTVLDTSTLYLLYISVAIMRAKPTVVENQTVIDAFLFSDPPRIVRGPALHAYMRRRKKHLNFSLPLDDRQSMTIRRVHNGPSARAGRTTSASFAAVGYRFCVAAAYIVVAVYRRTLCATAPPPTGRARRRGTNVVIAEKHRLNDFPPDTGKRISNPVV